MNEFPRQRRSRQWHGVSPARAEKKSLPRSSRAGTATAPAPSTRYCHFFETCDEESPEDGSLLYKVKNADDGDAGDTVHPTQWMILRISERPIVYANSKFAVPTHFLCSWNFHEFPLRGCSFRRQSIRCTTAENTNVGSETFFFEMRMES